MTTYQETLSVVGAAADNELKAAKTETAKVSADLTTANATIATQNAKIADQQKEIDALKNPVPPPSPVPSTRDAILDAMAARPGLCLNPTWGITQAEIKALAPSLGHVRVDEEDEVDKMVNIPPERTLAAQVLGWAIGAGLRVQLCIAFKHYQNKTKDGYGPYMALVTRRVTDWASHIKTMGYTPAQVGIYACNEPTERQDVWWGTRVPQIVKAIRAVLPDHLIFIGTTDQNAAGGWQDWFHPMTLDTLAAYPDPNVIPTWHNYFDGAAAKFTGPNGGAMTLAQSGCTSAMIKSIYDKVRAWEIKHDRRTAMNEAGCWRVIDPNGSALWLGWNRDASKSNKIPATLFKLGNPTDGMRLSTGPVGSRILDPIYRGVFA